MTSNIKCIVLNCINHSDEGEFINNICWPCHHYITTGEKSDSQAYRNALETVKAKLSTPHAIIHIMEAITKTISAKIINPRI